jgi:hypothetical protein
VATNQNLHNTAPNPPFGSLCSSCREVRTLLSISLFIPWRSENPPPNPPFGSLCSSPREDILLA